MFEYKNHAGSDAAHRLIRTFTVTSAAIHDGAQLPEVLAKNTASAMPSGSRSSSNRK